VTSGNSSTAGTDHHRFDRLIDMVETWALARRSAGRPVRVFFQRGTSHAPQGYQSIDYLPFDEMASMMRSARAVVSHAGPATIMDARAAGRVPIVLPRRHELDEHVDNHQVHFATLLHERGEIFLARNADHLGELLDAALAKPASFAIAADADVRRRATTARIAELVEGAVTAGERPGAACEEAPQGPARVLHGRPPGSAAAARSMVRSTRQDMGDFRQG
jgi:UDP-N-acetylglucosamine transferase subunit ALG13